MDFVADSVVVPIAEDSGAVFVAVIEVGMVVDAGVGLGIKVGEVSVAEEEEVGMPVLVLVDMVAYHLLMRRLDQVVALDQHTDRFWGLEVRRTAA